MTQITCKPCCVCGKQATIVVNSRQFNDWKPGVLVQVAFPTLSVDERELLISGTHSECWKKLFKEDK